MAGSKTAYLAQKLLDHMLGGAAYAPPATLYVCLSTAAFDPAATGAALNEITAGDYARHAVANDAATWSAATAGWPSGKHNLIDIPWDTATSAWGTPLSAYLADAAAAGNLLYGADISNAQVIGTGDIARIPATAIIFEED